MKMPVVSISWIMKVLLLLNMMEHCVMRGNVMALQKLYKKKMMQTVSAHYWMDNELANG